MSQALAHFPLTAALPEDARQPYRPYEKHHTGKQKMVLDLVDADGATDSLYYPYLLRVRYTPPRLLSVVYFDGVFTLTGRDLGELRALLRDYVVSEIRVFNAWLHLPPPPGTPLIEALTIEPRRPLAWPAT